MRGSVVKRGSMYSVKIELDPDPATGKRRQKWHSGYRTKKEAERARIDLLSKVDRGEYVEATRQTLGQYLEEWLRTIEPTIRPSTFNGYRSKMENHVIDHIGRVTLSKVDAGVLNGLYAKLLASGRRNSSRKGIGYSAAVVRRAQQLRDAGFTLKETADQLRDEFDEANHITKDTLASLLRRQSDRPVDAPEGLDPNTVRAVHTILHRAFKDAVRWGRLARNPCDAADAPRVPQDQDNFDAWDATTLRRFLTASAEANDPYHPLWVLLATTGMRRGEALGLRWADVDLNAVRLRVVQTIINVRGKLLVGEPKTAKGRRPISLDAGTVDILKEHRKRLLREQRLVGSGFVDEGLVFHRPDGSCLRPETVSATFLRRQAKLDVPRLTLKGLRHTWATLALEQGIHPRVVQERLGHSTIAVTLGIYSHVAPTLHDEAAEQVAGLIL